MVREVVRDDEPRVVVHERREVEPLVTAEQEREDVRLPHLIRLRALEATRWMLARTARRTRLDEPRLVQNAAHGGLGDTDGLEAREEVADGPSATLRVLLLGSNDGVAFELPSYARRLARRSLGTAQRVCAVLPVVANPLADSCR